MEREEEEMITIGVDAHKEVHVAEAVDRLGRPVSQQQALTQPRDGTGYTVGPAASAASGSGESKEPGVTVAGWPSTWLAGQETVYEINPRWTAQSRRKDRKRDKSDPLDARAVALWTLREANSLAPVELDDCTAELDLLVGQRDSAVAESTRLRNQIHSLLLQLDPEYKKRLPVCGVERGASC